MVILSHIVDEAGGSNAIRRPRVLFYSHDAVGLGHLSRIALIAQVLARVRPDVVVLLVTGASNPFAFALPSTVEIVRLPTAANSHLFRGMPSAPDMASVGYGSSGLWQLRARIIEAAVLGFQPDLIFVDHIAQGFAGEFTPTLHAIRQRDPRPALVLGMHDFDADPATSTKRWEFAGFDPIRTEYDRIVVMADQKIVDTAELYLFPPEVRAKTSYSGYVARRPARSPGSSAIRASYGVHDRPLVLVTTGSGRFGESIISTYLQAIVKSADPGFASIVVTGPALPAATRASLTSLASRAPRVTMVDFLDDLPGHMQAADLVVTMAGYGSPAEVMALGKRAIVIPRVRPYPEQFLRAKRLAELGLMTMIHPDELTVEGMWEAVLVGLAAPPPPRLVDCDGADRIAQLISELLGPSAPRSEKTAIARN